MNIKKCASHIFFKNENGIVLDDAYDIIKRKGYIKYVEENNIKYIRSQDVDMVNITFFPDIEYLSVPSDAENLKALYTLENLRGISLGAEHLQTIDLSNFPQLEYLEISDQPYDINKITKISTLKHLSCMQWKMENLNLFNGFDKMETLVLDFCRKMKSLQGLKNLISLNNLTIEYCLKLVDIDHLMDIRKSLKILNITDCNKIKSYDIIEKLIGLEELKIATFQTNVRNSIKSLDFINNLKELKRFYTNYKIVDGDMSPLLNVENAICDN